MRHLGFVCNSNWYQFQSISIQSSERILNVLVMYIVNMNPLTLFCPFYNFFSSESSVEGTDAQNIGILLIERIRACKPMTDYSEYSRSWGVTFQIDSSGFVVRSQESQQWNFLFACWVLLGFIFLTANPILVSVWQAFQKQLVHDHMPCWHRCELISHMSSWSIRAAPCAEGQLVPWHVKQLMNFSSKKP